MNAHSVSGAAAEMALQVPSGANGVRLSPSMKKRPTTPMMASGTNLSTVVTTCTAPVSRAPAMLTKVSSQMTAMPTSAASRLFDPRSPQKTARYPTKATAIAALPAHAAIQ